jgi:hypothetical protein
MRCEDLDRWLDEGMPEGGADAALEHAARCPRCAASLEAARAVEAALASAPAAAPAGFAGRVMGRVAGASAARVAPLAPWLLPSAMPWWTRAAAEPRVVLAAALAALVVWRADVMATVALSAASWLAGTLSAVPHRAAEQLARASGPEAAALLDPAVRLGLMLAVASVLAVASIPLYRWTADTAAAGWARGGRRRVSLL